MTEGSARRVVRDLLQGVRPSRPLFLPIVFTLGAKTENVPLKVFLANATKISNSLRQIRAHVQSDGLACYFDRYLEVEALGGVLQWDSSGETESVEWPPGSVEGELPKGMKSAEEAINAGRIRVAVDVIRRLKAMQRDDCVLYAGVSGPITLAARLTQSDVNRSIGLDQIPEDALEFATSMTLLVASAFAEAAADVVFLQESALPPLDVESGELWAGLLTPVINRVRFYESLPALHFGDSASFAGNSELILQQNLEAIICVPLEPGLGGNRCAFVSTSADEKAARMLGVSLPIGEDSRELEDAVFDETIERLSEVRPVVVTSQGDASSEADVKRLRRISERFTSWW